MLSDRALAADARLSTLADDVRDVEAIAADRSWASEHDVSMTAALD
jgi:hypothetical protein